MPLKSGTDPLNRAKLVEPFWIKLHILPIALNLKDMDLKPKKQTQFLGVLTLTLASS